VSVNVGLRCLIRTSVGTGNRRMPGKRRGKSERPTAKRVDVHLRRHDSCARAADKQIERIQSNNTCLEKSFLSVSACHTVGWTSALVHG
jgi:hypothetical protein